MVNEIIGPGNKDTEENNGDYFYEKFKPEFPLFTPEDAPHPDMAVLPGGDHCTNKDGPDHDEPRGFFHGRGRPLEENPRHDLYKHEDGHGDDGGDTAGIFSNMKEPQYFFDGAFQF